jgi:hypothetical protein
MIATMITTAIKGRKIEKIDKPTEATFSPVATTGLATPPVVTDDPILSKLVPA